MRKILFWIGFFDEIYDKGVRGQKKVMEYSVLFLGRRKRRALCSARWYARSTRAAATILYTRRLLLVVVRVVLFLHAR